MKTKEEYSQFIKNTFQKYPRNIGSIIKNNSNIFEFIMNWTKFLSNDIKKFTTRIYYAMNLLTDYPKCEICGKPVVKDVYRINRPCLNFCSKKCQFVKFKETFAKNHNGIDNSWKISSVISKIQKKRMNNLDQILDKMQQTCLERYGSKNPFQVEQFKEKAKQTLKSRIGYEHLQQSPEYYKKKQYKFVYNGIGFHSKDEINIWKFFESHLPEGTYFYQPDDGILRYKHIDGSEHITIVDFKVIIDGKIYFVEFKGGQFINSDGTWRTCFRDKDETDEEFLIDCQNYELKHKCLIDNNVIIIEKDSSEKNILKTFEKYGIILKKLTL